MKLVSEQALLCIRKKITERWNKFYREDMVMHKRYGLQQVQQG